MHAYTIWSQGTIEEKIIRETPLAAIAAVINVETDNVTGAATVYYLVRCCRNTDK